MKTGEQHAMFAIAITVIASYLYFMVLNQIRPFAAENSHHRKVLIYLIRKFAGFLILGLIPGMITFLHGSMQPGRLFIIHENISHLWTWMLAVSALLILLSRFNSRSADIQSVYPEMRLKEWNPVSLSVAVGGWIIYLAGYEYLFRGILLSGCVNAFGTWPAIVVNLALYSTLHLPKGLKEATAAIPFGALLCYLTIESGSVVPAIAIHSLQAVSIEISCIYRNKEMTFSLIKK